MTKKPKNSSVGFKYGFKSGLEEIIAKQLKKAGIEPKYEQLKLSYIIPQSNHTYKPDFPVVNSIIIETKGRFLPADRKKMLLIKEQYPDIEFRFVFSNSKSKISKNSKTTYADWCEKHGFKYADKEIPKDWIKEIKECICIAN